MKWFTSVSFILLVVLTCSCGKPAAFDYRGIKNVKISSWGTDSSLLSMDLLYFNPNKYGVNLKNVNADISVNQLPLGHIVLDTMMHIPANAEFLVPASIKLDLKSLIRNSAEILLNNEVTIGAKGTSKVGKGGLFVTIPFEYEGKQKLNLF